MVSQADSSRIMLKAITREDIAEIFGCGPEALPPLSEDLFEKLIDINARWAAESMAAIISAIQPEDLKRLLGNRLQEA